MPTLGLGTWSAKEEEIEIAFNAALEAGYRHIDCAAIYYNQKAIGNILKQWIDSGKITRDELFIVSKLPPTGNRPEGVEKYLKRTLTDLQLDYLDLYLIHYPFGLEEIDDDQLEPINEDGEIKLDISTDHQATWTSMEQQVRAGKIRVIGLSNFNIQQIEKIIQVAQVPVSNLQIEMHIYFQQKELVDFCKSKGIIVTAYSPLGSRGYARLSGRTEDLFLDPAVTSIAQKHGKTAAQILLKFLIQKGVSAIPKSVNPSRIQENINAFNFNLDDLDMRALENLDRGPQGRIIELTSFYKGIDKHPEFPCKLLN